MTTEPTELQIARKALGALIVLFIVLVGIMAVAMSGMIASGMIEAALR